MPPQIRLLPDGRRLHLHDGPIDLIVQADGAVDAVEAAYRAAAARFVTVLDELCAELPRLRSPAGPFRSAFSGPVARCMYRAVAPFAAQTFVTPMAAIAGAVAENILSVMVEAAPLDRAFVNNGGDIALHCAPGFSWTIGMIDRPDKPGLFGRIAIRGEDAVRGIATSGWRGRSFSFGIADSVTVLASSASRADAAATRVANAVDLPGHPSIGRTPANVLQLESDLGERLVTQAVGPLTPAEIEQALDAGAACADALVDRDLIAGAALQVQGVTQVVGPATISRRGDRIASVYSYPAPSPNRAIHA